MVTHSIVATKHVNKCSIKMNAKDCDISKLVGCPRCDYSKSIGKGEVDSLGSPVKVR